MNEVVMKLFDNGENWMHQFASRRNKKSDIPQRAHTKSKCQVKDSLRKFGPQTPRKEVAARKRTNHFAGYTHLRFSVTHIPVAAFQGRCKTTNNYTQPQETDTNLSHCV